MVDECPKCGKSRVRSKSEIREIKDIIRWDHELDRQIEAVRAIEKILDEIPPCTEFETDVVEELRQVVYEKLKGLKESAKDCAAMLDEYMLTTEESDKLNNEVYDE